jgi:hypothetical protein
MDIVMFLLLLAALICFLLAALNVAVVRVGLVALGLACWVAVPLVAAAQTL